MSMSHRHLYPLRSYVDKAEAIVKATAETYNLPLVQIRGTGNVGRPERYRGGLVYVARVEACRRAISECIRPRHLAAALGISERRVRVYYQLLRANGFGPFCMQRAS